jgi:hypothetical protein
MKYLSHYTEKAVNEAIAKAGAFFAFSDKQFDEQKKENIKYVSMGLGLICPKENANQLSKDLEQAHDEGIKQDLAENGQENIIKRELANHEAYYTYDITSTTDALSAYGISKEAIIEVFNKEKNAHQNI